jgi:predicted amidohydrolase
MTGKYRIACVQASVEVIDDRADKDAVIARNLDRSLNIAEEAIVRDGAKVIVFPEGWLQGYNHTRSAEDWEKVCIQVPGLETARIGEFARKHQVYLAGAAFERDLDWPEVWFTTGFIVGPSGAVELRYRKLHGHNVEGLIPNVSPADVYSEYTERYGEDSIFPVLDTPHGRLAVIVENDLNYFELSRILVFHGAEILLHPTAEDNGPLAEAWDQARRSRAYENFCYLASANAGAVVSRNRAAQATRGFSTMINFLGNVDARIDGAGESVLVSTIELERLRRRRTEVFMNYPAQVKSEFFGNEFAKQIFMPTDTGPGTRRTTEMAIARLQKEGVFVAPSGNAPPEG